MYSTVVKCIFVIASLQYTLTIVTNNNKEVVLTEKMTKDNACFIPHENHAIPSIRRQAELKL